MAPVGSILGSWVYLEPSESSGTFPAHYFDVMVTQN